MSAFAKRPLACACACCIARPRAPTCVSCVWVGNLIFRTFCISLIQSRTVYRFRPRHLPVRPSVLFCLPINAAARHYNAAVRSLPTHSATSPPHISFTALVFRHRRRAAAALENVPMPCERGFVVGDDARDPVVGMLAARSCAFPFAPFLSSPWPSHTPSHPCLCLDGLGLSVFLPLARSPFPLISPADVRRPSIYF